MALNLLSFRTGAAAQGDTSEGFPVSPCRRSGEGRRVQRYLSRNLIPLGRHSGIMENPCCGAPHSERSGNESSEKRVEPVHHGTRFGSS
jgi:hypothetical protein